MAAFDADAKALDEEYIRRVVPEAAINSLTSQFINVTCMRTPYSRVTLAMIYPEDYPLSPLIVQLSSQTLPKPLLKKKEQECVAKATEYVKEVIMGEKGEMGEKGKGQVNVVYNVVQDFIQDNVFVPCWRELKQILILFESSNAENKVVADEKTGGINIRLKCKGYFQIIKVQVPEMYPEEGVKVEFGQGSFPPGVTALYLAHAKEIVRRCESGFAPDQAATALSDLNETMRGTDLTTGSTVRKAVEAGTKKDVKTRALDVGGIKALKHDVDVLSQISELRKDAKKETAAFQYEKHATAERKVARQKLRRLARAEQELDLEEEQLLQDMEQKEMLELLTSKCSDIAQPSLLPVGKYLLEEYINRLPQEPCQRCQETVFSPRSDADGTLLSTPKGKEKEKEKKGNRKPVRVFCGHWLHHQCLDIWLTTPPFIRDCPVCSRRIAHPAWPQDHKQLERAWTKQEAARREQSECADLMGF